MRFFVPGLTAEQNEKIWQELTDKGHQAVQSVTYEHEGAKFVVTVGAQRQEYPRETGPRGGYIKNAGHRRWATSTGSTVMLILNVGTVLEVHSALPARGWANPSLIGLKEIRSVEYFEAPAAGDEDDNT